MARQLAAGDLPGAPALKRTTTKALEWAPTESLRKPCNSAIQKLRQLSWQAAGVERNGCHLLQAHMEWRRLQNQLNLNGALASLLHLEPGECWELQAGQIEQLGWLWECRQRLITTGLLLEAAGFRRESRGGHFRSDAPASLPYWQHHTLQQRGKPIRSSAGPYSH
jgi:L-aspartate oxidase